MGAECMFDDLLVGFLGQVDQSGPGKIILKGLEAGRGEQNVSKRLELDHADVPDIFRSDFHDFFL